MSKGIQITIGAVFIAALVGWYGYTNLERYEYFQSLNAFQAKAVPGMSARIHGYVTPGTIVRSLETKTVRFAIQNDPPMKTGVSVQTLPVLYHSLETPDLFQDSAEVVVEGRIIEESGQLVFDASKVLAKCPSKFEGHGTEKAPFQTPPAAPGAEH